MHQLIIELVRKFATFIGTSLVFLTLAANVAAQAPTSSINIAIGTPGAGICCDPSTVLTNAIKIAVIIGALFALFMLITGAFDWITSEGEKENIDKARRKITNAFVGLAILALAIIIIRIVGTILNVDLLNPGAIKPLSAPQ